MKILFSLLAALLLGACTGPPEPLTVKQFVLRDQSRNLGDEPMTSMEKNRRLRGAVSMEERRQRLGQYYALLWHDPEGIKRGPVEVVFSYQQGTSGSRVKRMTRRFPAIASGGKAEFAIVGDDYFKNGKVLAWKATVSRGNHEIASKQSYLWQ